MEKENWIKVISLVMVGFTVFAIFRADTTKFPILIYALSGVIIVFGALILFTKEKKDGK